MTNYVMNELQQEDFIGLKELSIDWSQAEPFTNNKGSNPNKGLPLSDETKRKLSEALIGIKRSNEFKEKISNTLKGHVHSEESKIKMSNSHKGKTISEEQRKRQSESMKVNNITCPHCGLTGGISNMKRWHFNKCKQIKSI